MSEKKQTTLYLIETDDAISIEENIEAIIKEMNSRKKTSFFEEELTKNIYSEDFHTKMFFKINENKASFYDYYRPILTESAEKKFENFHDKKLSIIIFIWKEKKEISPHLYALCGGYSGFSISYYSNNAFGMQLLANLISKEDNVINTTEARSVTGLILSSENIYRSKIKFEEENTFSKIFKNIGARLDKEKLHKLGISIENNEQTSNCIAKGSFKLNKSITLQQTFAMIDHIDEILSESNNPITFNGLKFLNSRNRKDKNLIHILNEKLFSRISETIVNSDDFSSFSLYPKKIYDFYEIEKFAINNGTYKDILEGDFKSQVCIYLKKYLEKKETSEIKSNLSISYILNGQTYPVKNKFFHLLSTELCLQKTPYFYIQGDWFKAEETFIKDIDEKYDSRFKEYSKDLKLKKWEDSVSTEDEYNKSYLETNFLKDRCEKKQYFYLFHKILENNIEICDLISINEKEKTISLIHVKKGLNSTTRDLANQILISSIYIKHAIISNDFSLFENLFSRAKNYSNQGNYRKKIKKRMTNVKKTLIKDLVTDEGYKFEVVAAIKTNILNPKAKDINSYIAKFALVSLAEDLAQKDFTFKIELI